MSVVEASFPAGLLDRLPAVRGRLTANASLKNGSWFAVGGPAEVLFSPADTEDLAAFMKGCPKDVPLTLLGIGSNTLIRDGGIPGVVIRLGPRFGSIAVKGHTLTVGAAAIDFNIARAARDAGLGGLEFLSGIPGTLGGGLRMNAGAYGRELKDVLIEAKAIDRSGAMRRLTGDDMGLSYRHSLVPPDMVFVEAELHGMPDDPAIIEERIKYISESRLKTQPLRAKTAGSTFANPDGYKAWQLIEDAGCRGLRLGGAMMSDLHCNFMINTGDATAADLEALGEEVRRRVLEKSGIDLHWEIRRIGIPLEQGNNA